MSPEKSNHLIGNRPRDLPAGSIVPQPTTLPRAPITMYTEFKFNCLIYPAAFTGLEYLNSVSETASF
jgi:hypothetical protein